MGATVDCLGKVPLMFFFFSNRFGCLPSLFLSIAVTVLVVALLNR